MSGNPQFDRELCYFPRMVKVDEVFTPKWAFTNQGDADLCTLAVSFKGQLTPLWEGQLGVYEKVELSSPTAITRREVDRTQTLELSFILGVKVGPTLIQTDVWDIAVFVEVPVGLLSWPIALVAGGVGLVVVGVLVFGK